MEILRNPTASSDLPRRGVVTMGNFDGVHRGHETLVKQAVSRARELGIPAVALTFDPHPERALRPELGLRLLSTGAQRAQLLERLGIETLVEIDFDHRFAAISAEEFVRDYLIHRLEVREVWLGTNFHFGAERLGDVGSLSILGHELGFVVVGVDPVLAGDEVVSSTRIRREVARGHVGETWELLGRPFFVDGSVYRGERMGRRLGFPTMNIEVENELMPAHGVYVTVVHIPSFGRLFPCVTNIGVKPTVYEKYRVTVETHVIDFSSDVLREPVRLFFLMRLRDEKVFASTMELVGQIRRDVDSARLYFLQRGMPEGQLVPR
jgi:riboflavin kinase / FMN adenylyltransferase